MTTALIIAYALILATLVVALATVVYDRALAGKVAELELRIAAATPPPKFTDDTLEDAHPEPVPAAGKHRATA